MKYTSLTAIALAIGAFIAACSGSEAPSQPIEEEQPKQSTPIDAGSSKNDDDSKPAPSAKVCVSSCNSDSECASSCPSNGGTACCDQATKTCFPTKEAECPKTEPDGGDQPPAY